MPTQADNTHVRVLNTRTDDSQKQQMSYGTGRKDEQFGGTKTGVPIHQSYGRRTYPPKGSNMLSSNLDGNNDKSMMHIGEHPDYVTPALNNPEGGITDYDKWGHTMKMREDGWHWKIGSTEVVFYHDGHVDIIANNGAGKINLIGDVHAGSYAGVPAGKLGSMDDDSEANGPDALVSNLATKVWVT